MTVKQDAVVIAVTTKIVESVTALLSSFDNLEAAKEQLDGAGIDLLDWNDLIGENGNTQHASAEVYAGVLEMIVVPLVAYLKATEYAGKSFWNWLQSVRK